MKNKVVVIGYYTEGNGYIKFAENMMKSLNENEIRFYIKVIDNIGDWQKNTRYKAKFIKEMLLKLKTNLVYLDVDCTVKDNLSIFETIKEDVSFSRQSFPWRKNEALGGTIFISYNKRTIAFLDRWIKLNENYTGNLEQENMDKAAFITTTTHNLKVSELPVEYCYIFDNSKINYPNVIPKILHHQASRLLRT